MKDSHVHLDHYPLNYQSVLEFVNCAKAKGIDELNLLVHSHHIKQFRPIYEPLMFLPRQKAWLETDFIVDGTDYLNFIREMKSHDFGITVNYGIEVCYQEKQEELIKEILSLYPVDFLIGSVHAVDYISYDCDYSEAELFDKYGEDYVFRKYFQEIIALIESDLFDILGHVDTIKMWNRYPSYDLTDTFKLIARKAKQHHIIIENNTGCYYRYHHQDMGLNEKWLKLFLDYGCEMTTSSDSHKAIDVGSYLNIINKLMYND